MSKCPKCGYEQGPPTRMSVDQWEEVFDLVDSIDRFAAPMGLNRVAAAVMMTRMAEAFGKTKSVGDLPTPDAPEREQ